MSSPSDFRLNLNWVWFRLVTLAIVALIFSEALVLASGKAEGWKYYLTGGEVVFSVIVRLVAAALAGMLVGSVATALVAPVLWFGKSSGRRVAEVVVKICVVLVVFLLSRLVLHTMIRWSYQFGSHKAILDKALTVGLWIAFAVALLWPRTRRQVVSSLDGFLTEKMTRRTAIATVAGAAALVGTEYVLSKTSAIAKVALTPKKPKSNFLLITFDALSAEEMSLYGGALPTTPNIDAFARSSTVFTNYFAGSTFTTPCIGVILTGLYPSDSRVYGLSGQVPADVAPYALPNVMRASGYSTGAVLTNPWAYYLAASLRNGFDILPEPDFHPGGVAKLWQLTGPLHQDSGVASRIDEYFELEVLWNEAAGISESQAFRIRPEAAFAQASEVLSKLPDGFFMWVHVISPHHPYLPGLSEQGRYLPQAEVLSFENDPWTLWKPHYNPDQQAKVDRRRLAYDEFLITADRAFGNFVSSLESMGRLQNTTVIVSADHGESFEGGIYQHQTPDLTRPVIHIPLIIRTPGQEEGRTVSFTADQTSLAPTILDLASVSKPASMRGRSLVPWLKGEPPRNDQGLAFTQYLERNSIFKPLRRGTLGVIDSEYQYVWYLETQKGALRPLGEAQYWKLDRSAENEQRAHALNAAIRSRFSDALA